MAKKSINVPSFSFFLGLRGFVCFLGECLFLLSRLCWSLCFYTQFLSMASRLVVYACVGTAGGEVHVGSQFNIDFVTPNPHMAIYDINRLMSPCWMRHARPKTATIRFGKATPATIEQ